MPRFRPSSKVYPQKAKFLPLTVGLPSGAAALSDTCEAPEAVSPQRLWGLSVLVA